MHERDTIRVRTWIDSLPQEYPAALAGTSQCFAMSPTDKQNGCHRRREQRGRTKSESAVEAVPFSTARARVSDFECATGATMKASSRCNCPGVVPFLRLSR